MRKNLKKINLFTFSILIFSGLFSFSENNLNLKSNTQKISKNQIIDFEFNDKFYSAIIDTNLDGYGDSLYLLNNSTSNPKVIKYSIGQDVNFNNLYSSYFQNDNLEPLDENSIDISALDNESVLITLSLADNLNLFDEENLPILEIEDSEEENFDPIIDEESSDSASDTYVYTLPGLNPGTEYDFNLLTIIDSNAPDNTYQFKIDKKVITDYLISDVILNDVSENSATFDLDLSENNDFNFSNFDESQRQVKINFDDDTSFETEINLNNQIVIDGLNSSTSYNIESIDYYFDQNNDIYKYNILTPNLTFTTSDFSLILEENSFAIDDSSITTSSFEYKININNLDEDEINGGFTNYDPEDGLYLIDDNYNSYQTSYVEGSEVKIGDGQEANTFEYQFTFKISNLSSDKGYDFVGISFLKPLSESDSSIVNFNNDIKIKTLSNQNNFIYLWAFIAIILILFMIIILIISINLSLKKRNLKMKNALNKINSKDNY